MTRRVLVLLCALTMAGRALAEEEVRMWTLPGNRMLQAHISGIDDGKVLLMPHNGKTPVAVPTHQLQGTDRAMVDAWVPPNRRAAGVNAEITRNPSGWPLTVILKDDPSFTIVEEDTTKKVFVYRSDHFEFSCGERLNGQVVREFSRLFELTYETVAAMPLQIDPEAPRGWFKVLLYATMKEYTDAGGPKKSSGLYRGRTGEVMVPLDALGVKKTNDRWTMKNREGNQPLLHEVTHQLMGPWLTVLPVWLSEGAAEYMAAGRYRYSVRKLELHGDLNNILTFLREQMGVPERKVDMRHPQRLMPMDFEKWQNDLAYGDGIKNYYSAMLLFYYFAHLDGDGTGRALMQYFKARVASRTPENDTADRDKHLLRGRSFDVLWQDIGRVLAQYKIRIS